MQSITEIKGKELVPGVVGHYIHGVQTTFGYVTLVKGSVVPDHSHHNEQVTFILEGTLQMWIGGEEYLLQPGMVHVTPAHVVHSATAMVDCKLIDTFSPPRQDYK